MKMCMSCRRMPATTSVMDSRGRTKWLRDVCAARKNVSPFESKKKGKQK